MLDSASSIAGSLSGSEALVQRGHPRGVDRLGEAHIRGAYFNDRLVAVIGHLLQTPEVREPIALTVRRVLPEFADPALEDRSAGQKILLRMGAENAARVKARLRELR